MSEDAVELKPCPFCGSTDIEIEDGWMDGTPGWCAQCSTCGNVRTWGEKTEEAAIEAWNKRSILGNVWPNQIRIDKESTQGTPTGQ